MPRARPTNERLRAQIEAAASEQYSTESIEERIAAALSEGGRFHEDIGGGELAVVLRNLVYTIFSQQRFAGLNVGLVHNVPAMDIAINDSQANVRFTVHIHKPIVAFLKFKYVLVNDPESDGKKLRVKPRSLTITENTRRFDVKAKAALAAINVPSIARHELADPARVIFTTLPPRLERHGLEGELTSIELSLRDHRLNVHLEGKFRSLPDKQPSRC